MPHSSSLDKFCGGIIENHPFGELKVGDSASVTRTVTIDDLRLFAAATGDADDTPVYREALWKMPLVTGRWINWVLRADWNYTTGGALRIWRDRRMVYNESGFRNCYNDVLGLYPKLGVYVPLGLSAATPSRTVYHKGVVTGDNAYSTFDAFMAAAGSTDTELESVFTGALAAA